MKSLHSRMNPSGGRKSSPPNYSQLWTECAKRGLSAEPLIRTALQQLSINPSDFECAQIVLDGIRAHDTQELLNPDPFRTTNPTSVETARGPILLGKVQHSGTPWGIDPSALTEHMVIVGRTGGGKTTVIKAILRQLLEGSPR